MLRPHGTVAVVGGDGPEYQRDSVMCGHCNRHGLYQPGCGAKLGKCQSCGQTVCPDCARIEESRVGPCLCLERRLDLYEAGKLPTL